MERVANCDFSTHGNPKREKLVLFREMEPADKIGLGQCARRHLFLKDVILVTWILSKSNRLLRPLQYPEYRILNKDIARLVKYGSTYHGSGPDELPRGL